MFDFAVRDWSDVAAIVTVGGVPIALIGLWLAYRQLRLQASLEVAEGELQAAEYEDNFVREYRKLVQRIPTEALLGEKLSSGERVSALPEFYHYVDLCNEQAYQAKQGRIRAATWEEWKSGIVGNLTRPEFALAWSYIAAKSGGEFRDLREVVSPMPYDATAGYPPPKAEPVE